MRMGRTCFSKRSMAPAGAANGSCDQAGTAAPATRLAAIATSSIPYRKLMATNPVAACARIRPVLGLVPSASNSRCHLTGSSDFGSSSTKTDEAVRLDGLFQVVRRQSFRVAPLQDAPIPKTESPERFGDVVVDRLGQVMI